MKNTSSSDNSCFFLEINLEVPSYVYAINIATSVVNGVTSLVATVGNSLVIVAICRNASLHTSNNILLSCLAFSDLMVGLASQPAYIGCKVGENRGDFQLHCFAQPVTEAGLLPECPLLPLTVIDLERYISLFRPLRYNAQVMTRKTLTVIISFWFGLILFEASRFFFLDSNSAAGCIIIIAIITVCLSICFWAYLNIYTLARRHQNCVRDIAYLKARLHGINASSVIMQRKRKAAYAMVGVFLLVLISYFPMMSCLAVFQVTGFTVPVKAAFILASTAAFVNSSVSPLWNCWRLNKEIRKQIQKLLFKTKVTGTRTRKNGGLEHDKVCQSNKGEHYQADARTSFQFKLLSISWIIL